MNYLGTEYNEDGFPIDEKGNFIKILDENGNCIVSVGRREYDYDEEKRCGYCYPIGSNENDKKIIFSLTEQSQVRKAIKDIAKELRRDFKISLESELLPLNPENPAKIPTIKYYIDEVDSFLNYLGSVYGFNFEYSIYLEYKEITRNQLITAKTKLYNDRAITKSMDFVENWFNEKDKIYLQKVDLKEYTESKKQPSTEIYLDYSDNSLAERIVFLHELGILDFLQQNTLFKTSTNKLAEVISTFTGIEQKTAQSYLNPILSKKVDQKNNPMTDNNKKKVKEKLNQIGYVIK